MTIFFDKETYKQDNKVNFLKSYYTLSSTYFAVLTLIADNCSIRMKLQLHDAIIGYDSIQTR